MVSMAIALSRRRGTVAVPIFKNKDYRRGISSRSPKPSSTRSRCARRTKSSSAKRPTRSSKAIVSIDVHTVSQDTSSAIPQEQIYDIKVNFTWKDQRTGIILCDRRNFEQTTTFYSTLGEGEFEGSQNGVEPPWPSASCRSWRRSGGYA